MGWLDIGGRRTFVPPFVNERFTDLPANLKSFEGPPFWACTFTTGVNAANVAKLGGVPATQIEVIHLAQASGDADLLGGSRTSHLVAAMKRRYALDLRVENVGAAEARRRLATGWALIAGCWFGKLPNPQRRWSPGFTGGHRLLLVGWSAGRTRLIDPLAPYGPDYQGEWIAWDDFAPAWWSDDQAWVLEGELMYSTVTVHAAFDPERTFRVKAGATVRGFTLSGLRKSLRFDKESSGGFDRHVTITQSPDPQLMPNGQFVRASRGAFEGLYVPLADVTADVSIAPLEPSTAVLEEARREAASAAVTEERQRVRAIRDQAVATLGGI